MTFRKKLLVCVLMLAVAFAAAACGSNDSEDYGSTVSYEGKDYQSMEFSGDIFAYYYNGEGYFEEDTIYPVEGEDWDMLYYNEDIYCEAEKVEAAAAYYADDANYDWYIITETDDGEDTASVSVNEEEIAFFDEIESLPKDTAIFFEEIEIFATLSRVSKDGVISGVTELAYYDGAWYWRSEIIDESREENDSWPEYVYQLPDSLSDKISKSI